MIVLNLLCENEHRFEGWFASGEAFREQRERGLLQCPHCATAGITQLPAGPHVKRSQTPAAPVQHAGSDVAQQLYRALAEMARRADDVGDKFPEEARRIHYAEAPPRNIRGVASLDETRELIEEGIAVLPALTPADGEIH